MKTFQDEYRELVEWIIGRREESDKLPRDGIGLGYPSQRGQQEKADNTEYRL